MSIKGTKCSNPACSCHKAEEARRMARYRELSQMTKASLAVRHLRNGGLLSVVEYVKWKHEELVNAILKDEGLL